MTERKTYKTVNESQKAIQAYELYRDMGAGRTFDRLLVVFSDLSNPPTKSKGTLSNWSSFFNWDERVKKWDDEQAVLAQHRKREEEKEEHQKRLKLFREAGDRVAFNGISASSRSTAELQKVIYNMIANMKIPAKPTPKDVLEVATVYEKVQALADKSFELKSKIEGFDKIVRFIQSQQKAS